MVAETQQYCTFYLEDYFFGIQVEQVQEVIRFQEMTRVPLAPAAVRGLINLRGQIVSAVDLRRRLGLGERPAEQRPMNVVVRTADGAVSLLVDKVGDVLEVDPAIFEAPPATLKGDSRALIRGAYKLSDRLLLALDTDEVLNLQGVDRSRPRQAAPAVATTGADESRAAGTEPPPSIADDPVDAERQAQEILRAARRDGEIVVRVAVEECVRSGTEAIASLREWLRSE